MDTIKTDKYCFEQISTHLSAMFVYENQRERGVLKYGYQLYTGMGGYPVLGRAIIVHLMWENLWIIEQYRLRP